MLLTRFEKLNLGSRGYSGACEDWRKAFALFFDSLIELIPKEARVFKMADGEC